MRLLVQSKGETIVHTILLKAAAATAAAIILASPATAQDVTPELPWYVSANVGASLLRDARVSIANAPAPGLFIVTNQKIETGLGISIAAGRRFGPVRAEAEIGFTNNSGDQYDTISPFQNSVDTNTKFNSRRIMLNGYYDLLRGRVTPYVGAGIGSVRTHFRVFAARAPFPTEPPRELIDDRDTKFAYQLMAGAAFQIAPQIALTGQYRWLDAGRIKGEDSRNEQFLTRYRGHNLEAGIRFSF